MNKVYCYCYRDHLLQLSTSQTAVSAEPAISTGKPVPPDCTDFEHNSKYNRWVSSYNRHVSLSRDSLSGRVVCSRLTQLTQLRRHTDGVKSVQLVAVLTTSACAHHRFLQRQPVPIIGSYNVSLCPSSVPSTSEYFLLITFERECSYIKVKKADLWPLSQAAV